MNKAFSHILTFSPGLTTAATAATASKVSQATSGHPSGHDTIWGVNTAVAHQILTINNHISYLKALLGKCLYFQQLLGKPFVVAVAWGGGYGQRTLPSAWSKTVLLWSHDILVTWTMRSKTRCCQPFYWEAIQWNRLVSPHHEACRFAHLSLHKQFPRQVYLFKVCYKVFLPAWWSKIIAASNTRWPFLSWRRPKPMLWTVLGGMNRGTAAPGRLMLPPSAAIRLADHRLDTGLITGSTLYIY